MAKTIPRRATPAENKSWRPGQKGQGGEGMSKGYGGSAGDGTGPSGPEADQPNAPRKPSEGEPKRTDKKQAAQSESLPSPQRIAEILR